MHQVESKQAAEYEQKTCDTCGSPISVKAEICPNCGVRQKKVVNKAVLLIITFFIGGIGAHKFYQKKYGQGFLYLLLFWTGIPGIIALIEFLIYAFTSREELQRRYPDCATGGLIIGIAAGGVVLVMVVGILAAIAIPNFIAYRNRAYDSAARSALQNAYTASMAYYVDHPDGPEVTMDRLKESGYTPFDKVRLTIENGTWERLRMRAFHEEGKRVFIINTEGKISFETRR